MTQNEIMELAESVQLADNGMIAAGDYTEELVKFFRLAYARVMLKQAEQSKHWSDCAVNSEPAYPAGDCDRGGYDGTGSVTIVRQWQGLTNADFNEITRTSETTAYAMLAVEIKLKEKNT